ncbi:MAG: NB-ARC domain-containing protein [Nodosilinea sp.]
MASDAVEQADELVFTVTGRHLNDLQRTILHQVWQGRKYLDIARRAGYTEGHVKDVAYQLWKLLSRVTGEKITKATLKSALKRSCGAGAVDGPASAPLYDASAQVTVEASDDPLGFVGRQVALGHLHTLIVQGHRAIVLQGEGGVGKTTLAQHFMAQQPVDLTLELLMAKDTADLTPVEWVVEEWLRQDFGIEPGREFGVTLDRLKRHLRQRRVAVLIDNLEPGLDAQGKFIPAHRRYGELLRILTDFQSQTITLMTSRDRLCEPGLPITHYRLPGLDLAAWASYFAQRGLGADEPTLAAMHSAYGGNAKAMEILCGAIQADFGGNLAAYWQANNQNLLGPVDLKNLVESQMLRLQGLDPEAHRLFCRLGVYRYQDVPTLPLEGLLALMADLSPERQHAIVTSLRNRSLLECRQGHYWLHPVVRAGALTALVAKALRLQNCASKDASHQDSASEHSGSQESTLNDWLLAHRHAAAFWTDSTPRLCTRTDAVQALEAYYHYVAIADYEAAARVILHSRDNQWQQFLPLGSTLYRMGLVQPVTDAITAIIDRIPSQNSDASELYNILGDLYWIQGRIHAAMDCQKNAMAIAQGCLKGKDVALESHRWYYLTMLAVDSQLSLGLYHLDLWELDTAATWFNRVIATARGTRHHGWADKATICLALVQSHQGQPKAAKALADSVVEQVLDHGRSGRYAFFTQLLGHTYLNFEDIETAHDLFKAAIHAADAGHYQQIKANALSGLGRLEGRANRLEAAIAHHRQAIALLEEVGAQCDLAAAHLQLALTLREMGQGAAATQKHFQAAIQIFKAIPAEQQMRRVYGYLAQGLTILADQSVTFSAQPSTPLKSSAP